jgi:hydrogenase maturation protease
LAPESTHTVIVGCGNLIRGDDAAGPILVRLLADRDLPPGVRLIDGGTAGMDVAFAMRGARRAIVVDASRVGVDPGTVHRVPGSELVDLQPPQGGLHSFRWDQALGFAQWLLKDGYPADVTVWLVEGESFDAGAPLTPAVQAAVEGIAEAIAAELCDGETLPAQDSIAGPRPQPLGALDWPAGMLLLPDVPGAAEVASELVLGARPATWPEGLEFLSPALAGDAEAAAALLTGDDVVSRYNRAVLIGGDEAWDEVAARSTGDLRSLADVGRYSVGLIDDPPRAEDIVRPEVVAMVLSARASAAIEAGDPGLALEQLAEAVAAASRAGSPNLAASLRLTRSEFLRERAGDSRAAASEADAGLALLTMTSDQELRASLHLARALARQDVAGTSRGALLAVVADLNEATKVFRDTTHPEMFALCNHHLALAYLTMPMSDQGDRLRLGVAVNSLRAALTVYTPEEHPSQWAAVKSNLANALQYLPSVHQESNLDEAVQLYEEVLQRLDPRDPAARARLLANQGNALGHLGVFADARVKLLEAQELFGLAGEEDSAEAVAETLDELDRAERAATAATDI